MATLYRVDVDAVNYSDLSPQTAAETPVAPRPSREFAAHPEEAPRASRASWLGLLFFVSLMLSIVVAATLVAVDEQVVLMQRDQERQPGITGFLEEQARALGFIAVDAAQLPAPRPPAVPAVTRPLAEPTGEVEAPRAHEPALLSEVVFVNPEPSHAAPAPRAARTSRGRAKAHVAPAPRPRVSAPAAQKPSAPAGNWDEERTRAREAYAAGRFGDAVRAYERAVAANPSHALTLAGLGAARMQTGDRAGAVDAYKRAVKLAPDNVTFQVALARAYVAAGDEAKARAAYQRVLTLEPGHVGAQAALENL